MKVGVMVHTLGALTEQNQLLVKEMNKFVENSTNDGIVFYQEPSIPCSLVRFAIMQMTEAYSFDGIIIATSFSLAQKMLNFPGPIKKIYYVWQEEWTKMKNPLHSELCNVYRNSNIEVIGKNLEISEKISYCWNIPQPKTVERFNIEEMVKDGKSE